MSPLSSSDSNKILVLTGPTAIGKSELSFRIQQEWDCQIISADSRQVYKEMAIGTAKPTDSEINNYQIRCCNHVSIHEEYNAGMFAKQAMEVARQDWAKNTFSFVCGGTGLYIKAFTEGIDVFPHVPKTVTDSITAEWKEKGIKHLQSELKEKDLTYYANVDIMNPHRLIRALSVIRVSELPYSRFLDQQQQKRFDILNIVLERDKVELNARIDSRVDQMFNDGLIDEAQGLLEYEHLKALNTVGYSEAFQFLKGEIDLTKSKELIKTHTHQYAKRQRTWQRKYNVGPRFHPSETDAIFQSINSWLQSD